MLLLSRASFSRYKKLEDLLEKSFSLVKMPSLQPVVMCVMKHLPKVRVKGHAPRAPACSPAGQSSVRPARCRLLGSPRRLPWRGRVEAHSWAGLCGGGLRPRPVEGRPGVPAPLTGGLWVS